MELSLVHQHELSPAESDRNCSWVLLREENEQQKKHAVRRISESLVLVTLERSGLVHLSKTQFNLPQVSCKKDAEW